MTGTARRLAVLMVLASAFAVAVPTVAQIDAAQRKIIAQDPPFVAPRLELARLPTPAGPATSLFNGRDLHDWDIWLGYADPSLTYLKDPGTTPLGTRPTSTAMFQIVDQDGRPALYVEGSTWGSIVHHANFRDYHLRLQFKWGDKRHAPRVDQPPNNGLLYHSHGAPGTVFGTWMPALEFEIMSGSTGMLVPVGSNVTAVTEIGHDASLAYPQRRFMPGGRKVRVGNPSPAWNVENSTNAELPVGQWNTLDLYVLGDRSIHVVNGVPVMVLSGISETDAKSGKLVPLTSGRIQLQSEGADVFFRDITVEPIRSLPNIVKR